jgi:nicotinamide riboside kinase
VALLGAESTGKTTLSHALAAALRAEGHAVAVVPERLRAWCEAAGRAPTPEEHRAIAQAQDAGLAFPGDSTWDHGLRWLRGCELVLLAGLDLPWTADGLQRAGPAVRAQVDAQLRAALDGAGIAYRVVYGRGEARLRNALAPVQALLGEARHAAGGGWLHACANCGDPACERRLFRRLAGA